MAEPWDVIEAEARDFFAGAGRFPILAYSELMPPPYVVVKPYAPSRAARAATVTASGGDCFDVTEYDLAHELEPGLAKIAAHVLSELGRLLRGQPHELSRTLLEGNPAWPADLAGAPPGARPGAEPLAIALSLALSLTQDDKGNVRWTLFGVSHDGPAPAFWRSFGDGDGDRLAGLVGWMNGRPVTPARLRVLSDGTPLPAFARALAIDDAADLKGVDTVVTFRPFGVLPEPVRRGFLAGRLRLFPHPSTLIFFGHPGYHRLAQALPRAAQIPLLHLFGHVEGGYDLRIPQSGWLDEQEDVGKSVTGRGTPHAFVSHIVRSHRWQRVARDARPPVAQTFHDRVSVALFSTDPDDLGLYGKPMARNAQIWSEKYDLILDGPRATPLEIERASDTVDRGGRFGFRFFYPPMRAGAREIFWHLPLLARLAGAETEVRPLDHFSGYLRAEPLPERPEAPALTLAPRLLRRPGHFEAATAFPRDDGRPRFSNANNIRKLLELHELLEAPLDPALARASVRTGKQASCEDWLAALPDLATDRAAGERVRRLLGGVLCAPEPLAPALTFDETATRAFEEKIWHTIAGLAEGEFRMKETADAVLVNKGKTGGPAAKAVALELAQRRDLERLGDHLHERYRALIDQHQMTGRAEVADHVFRWETDFPFAWSEAWRRNQERQAHERNIVVRIPGRNRHEAVVMADHYDTAYMEDVYEDDRGGDGLRAAAAGADDNHSATTALLAAADVLLARSRAGTLERDVWLVHLTGEEFPADCQGARALASALCERRLRLGAENGGIIDVSGVRVVGAYVLDMIAHNHDRDRDVFQIAPGEGAASARLAVEAQRACARWNERVRVLNATPERKGEGRAQRREDGAHPPPPFAHLALHGEIRTEWDPRSSLYNTDGQIFSDVGIPVVLFMENYDINRTGYHDTHDTMKNIDLDYGAALIAIAIETVATVASRP